MSDGPSWVTWEPQLGTKIGIYAKTKWESALSREKQYNDDR